MHPYQAGPPMPATPTVGGIPLEPGERVIYFHHTNNIGTRLLLFFMGIPLIPLLIGIAMVVSAFMNHRDTQIVTNRRFLRIEGKKPANVMALGGVTRVEWRRSGRYTSAARMYDAAGRLLELRVMHDDKFRDLVRSLLEDPSRAEALPGVMYDP